MTPQLTRRRLLQAGSAAGIALLGGAGCVSSNVPGKIRYVGYVESQQQLKGTDAAIRAFVRKHPKVSVSTEFSDFSSYVDKVTTQIAGGNEPDMMSANVDVLSQYAQRTVLRQLDRYNPSRIDLRDYATGSVGAARYDGRLYGIPNDVVGPAVIYNTDMLRKLGVRMPGPMCTWEQLADTAKAAAKAGGAGVYGMEDRSSDHITLDVFLRPHKKIFFAADGRLGFAKSDLVRWLTYWHDLRQAGATPPAALQAEASGDDLSKSLLIRNKAAMIMQLTDSWLGLQALTPRRLDLHMLPNGFTDAPIKQNNFVYAGNMTCIPKKSRSVDDILDLINFLHNDPEGSRIFYGNTGIIPASAKARERVRASGSTTTKKLIDYLEPLVKSSAEARHSGPTEVNDILKRTSEAVAFGRQSPEQAAEQFFSDAGHVYEIL